MKKAFKQTEKRQVSHPVIASLRSNPENTEYQCVENLSSVACEAIY